MRPTRILALALATCCVALASCKQKAPDRAQIHAIVDVTVPCQVLPGPAQVGLGFQDSILCKADGTKSVLFYGDTIPAIFYPDGDQHAFFDRNRAPFPVINGKIYMPVLRAAGTHWYPIACWSGYLTCRSRFTPPTILNPWPTNTCTDVHDWQVFDPATLNWTNQADFAGGPLLPLPDVNQTFVCPTPIPTPVPTQLVTRVPTLKPVQTPLTPPPPTSPPVTIAPSPRPSVTCPVCPTCPPPQTTPVPPGATATKTKTPAPVVSLTKTKEPCFPPFCVSPAAVATTTCVPIPGSDVCPTPDHLPQATANVTVVASSGCSSKKNAGVPGELLLLAVALVAFRRQRP